MDSAPERSLTSNASNTNNMDMPTTIPLPPSPSPILPPSPPLTEDTSTLSYSSDKTGDTAGSDSIRKIPIPQFPRRVFTGESPRFSLEAQRAVMRWSHERRHFLPDPNWIQEPRIEHIKDIVWPYLEQLGADFASIWVEFLAEGGFNRVYTVHTINKVANITTDYVFRVALPVDPYFKTESEVATTEIVRHFTNVPIPIIYAYDSSTENAVGLEWILMEKIIGKKLDEIWESLDYDTKLELTKTVTSWTAHLSKITSNKIGNIYMRYTETDLEFYVGRSVDSLLSQENRLTYNIPRGPFKSLQEYYAAVLDAANQDVTHLTEAFDSCSFKFEPTPGRPTFQGTFLDQSVFYYLEDYEERIDEDWKVEQRRELEMLLTGIKLLRAALPVICAKAPESSGALFTYLAHDDLSRRNIFVDDVGTPLALLDWEALNLEPLLFLTNPPVCIQTYDYDFDEPVYDPVEDEKRFESLGYSEEERIEDRKSNAEAYAERIEQYICTKLRREYQKELERLGSPLAKAVWDDYPLLDRQLLERVLNTSTSVNDLVEWVEEMRALGEESDEEVNDDDNDDENSNDTEVDSDAEVEEYCESEVKDTVVSEFGYGASRWLRLMNQT